MTAVDPRPDTTPTTGGVDGEVGAWRQLVTNYRQAWADYDRLPTRTPLRLLEARARVAGTRLALFAYLDLRTPEETT